jgi:hypothetical protein
MTVGANVQREKVAEVTGKGANHFLVGGISDVRKGANHFAKRCCQKGANHFFGEESIVFEISFLKRRN